MHEGGICIHFDYSPLSLSSATLLKYQSSFICAFKVANINALKAYAMKTGKRGAHGY
jgi:UDP-glucose 6-dehydrogenase